MPLAYHAARCWRLREAAVGNRLSKIYTRTGDDGTTGLADGDRVDKCDVRVAAIGSIDETNSVIGLLLAEPVLPHAVAEPLRRIQHELFEIGAELTLPGYVKIAAPHVARLESDLDALNDTLPPLAEFVLPGGNRAAAVCHVARTVCRRAERQTWAAAKQHTVNAELLRYLNRLSDLLFVMARALARQNGGEEILWRHEP
jgi:cob(I)alamin adenosyltransferase